MSQPKEIPLMEKIVSLCKRKGFIFQSSEIYGGINGFWDYGPLGAELKRNLRDTWWKAMMREREDVVPLDATIIMHPAIWKASGHVDTFSDPMVDCLVTKRRFRADHVEPQSGWVAYFAGAVDLESFAKLHGERNSPERSTVWSNVGLAPILRVFSDNSSSTYGEEFRGGYIQLTGDIEQQEAALQSLIEAKIFASSFLHAFSVLDVGNSTNSFTLISSRGLNPAVKVAQEFYRSRGVQNPVVILKKLGQIENTRAYNPENGAQLTEPKPFNLMFKTYQGATATEDDIAYLRPETAQAIFAQFKNVVDSSRVKVPFGIGQIGKAFRNEVTPRNFTFRSREFEQMELEFFIQPDEAIRLIHGSVAVWSEGADLSTPQPNWGWEMWHRYWVAQRTAYYAGIGLGPEVLDYHWQKKDELAHYARACVDILFKFPFGTEELEGIAARSDFDLTQHQKHSGKPLEVFDEELRAAAVKLTEEQRSDFVNEVREDWNDHGKSRDDASLFCERLLKGFYVPHVIEPSAGLDRLALAVLTLAFSENEKTDAKGNKEVLTVMRFHPRIAPVKVGVFPLLKNKPELVAKARAVFSALRGQMACFYDEGGSIGKRYARQDEAGTPFCVTVDFDTIGENGPELLDTVTLRHRDDGRQERVKIAELLGLLLPQVQ